MWDDFHHSSKWILNAQLLFKMLTTYSASLIPCLSLSYHLLFNILDEYAIAISTLFRLRSV